MPTITAYPYLRYSTGRQGEGDSERRQADWYEQIATQEGWTLDYSLQLEDKGRSAFKGDHLKHDLGRFLQAINDGTVEPGSVLLFEELDRLSRQPLKNAFGLFAGILSSGVFIRTRERLYREEDLNDLGTVVGVIVKQKTANDESAKKSFRIGANWAAWREQIGAGKKIPPPGKMPPWICWDAKANDFALVPKAAAAVKMIFRLAGDGLGLRRILAVLNAPDGPPTIGRCPTWRLSYLAKLLTGRAVLGELKDAVGTVHNLYPAAVTRVEYQRARDALEKRQIGNKGVGRNGDGVTNIFLGLLLDARDGSRIHVIDKGANHGGGKYLIGSGSLRREAGSVRASFPLPTFEAAVLKLLREIDPREILGQKRELDEVKVLQGELQSVEKAVATLAADLEAHGESPALFKRLRDREAQQRDLADKLEKAQALADHPMSKRWGEAQAALDKATDKEDARLRLWAALRRIVDGIWCLFVPKGKGEALAAVQMHFKGSDRRRDYLIFHRASFSNGKKRKPAAWQAWSNAFAVLPGDLDLRKPAHVKRLERVLLTIDPRAAD